MKQGFWGGTPNKLWSRQSHGCEQREQAVMKAQVLKLVRIYYDLILHKNYTQHDHRLDNENSPANHT